MRELCLAALHSFGGDANEISAHSVFSSLGAWGDTNGILAHNVFFCLNAFSFYGILFRERLVVALVC